MFYSNHENGSILIGDDKVNLKIHNLRKIKWNESFYYYLFLVYKKSYGL